MLDRLFVKKLSPNAKLPTRTTQYAAGYDLYAAYDSVVPSRGQVLVKTDIAVRLPHIQWTEEEPTARVYGSIRSRSGLSLKHKIEVGAGVIDMDYTNNVGVILYNHGDEDFVINKHDRIAQLILEVHYLTDVVEVDELYPLEDNQRGELGFGSSGR